MKIFKTLKKFLYFWVAAYFGFFASIYLKRWKPTIITVIGSSGKTTLLHLFESQLGNDAVFSHKANSAFGIPFHILGLERKSFSLLEWPLFALRAPFQIFRKLPDKKIYVTEADAERPGEGKFLAKLLKPDVVVWLSLEEAHGVNYDRLVDLPRLEDSAPLPKGGGSGIPPPFGRGLGGGFYLDSLKTIIAYEFSYFLQYTKKLAVLNKDNSYIRDVSTTTKAEISWVAHSDITVFALETADVAIKTTTEVFDIPALVPPDAALSVLAVRVVIKYLELPFDYHFSEFELPPGRSSVFLGKKNTTIIDSSYNATFDGMRTMLDLISRYPALGPKWLVLGDMIEQGKSEVAEHALLADLILQAKPEKVILVGPRLLATTYPLLLKQLGNENVVSFLMPAEALEYLNKNIQGGETILFKGARFLEGVVEKLLEDPADAAKLCRREEIWVKRRKQWGI